MLLVSQHARGEHQEEQEGCNREEEEEEEEVERITYRLEEGREPQASCTWRAESTS
jgi:hypothetical protein